MAAVLSQGFVLAAEASVPAWHTRILWESIARRDGAAITASSNDDAEGFAEAPVSDQTFEWWRPAALPATWTVTTGEAATCNAVGIAVHDLATQQCTVRVQTSDDGMAWTDIPGTEHAPASNAPILLLFETLTALHWRIRITANGTLSGPPRMGVAYLGRALAMLRPVKWMGHSPGVLSRVITKRPSSSDRGQRLGTTIVRGGYEASYEVDNLPEDWIRAEFDPFALAAQDLGYFIAWRPQDFPKEVLFGWTEDPIVPQNTVGGRPPRQGPTRRRMSVSWRIRAHGGYEQGVHPWA